MCVIGACVCCGGEEVCVCVCSLFGYSCMHFFVSLCVRVWVFVRPSASFFTLTTFGMQPIGSVTRANFHPVLLHYSIASTPSINSES